MLLQTWHLELLHPQQSTFLSTGYNLDLTVPGRLRSHFIKRADKGSSLVAWNRSDYLHETSRQLHDQNIYENVKFNENILTNLVAKSNKIFKRLCSHKLISEKELKYFTYNFKKATNLGKLYFLPKMHKHLSAAPGRPVISNWGTPTEKVSEYLDYFLKPIMQDSWSYIWRPS